VKSLMIVAIGWSAWMFVLAGLLADRRARGPWTFGRVLPFVAFGLLTQMVCYWTLGTVLSDLGAARMLLVGAGIGVVVITVLVILLHQRFARSE